MWISDLLDLVFRGIPESTLFIFAGYALTRHKVEIKKLVISSVILVLVGFIIARILPIHFGITQTLVIIACASLLITVNHIPMQKAIAASLGVMILGFVSEIISVVLMAMLKGISLKTMFANTELFDSLFTSELQRLLYGLVPLIIMAVVLFGFYFLAKKKGTLKNAPDRKDIE